MSKKRIYTIATSHLDTVWSWDLEESIDKYIYDTLVDNFKMFEKYPNYIFSFEGSYRYELMEEYYPELFKKMTEYVNEGRWNVCGSAFENGDVNVPSPEALFRNILIGNSYFRNKFGKTSCDIYLPDCFGFGWALPSVMHHANLKGFTTQKLSWGGAFGTPFDIGRWRGVDGKEVYSTLKLGSYAKSLDKLRDWDFIEEKFRENEAYDLPWTTVFHGTGDRGGAPKEKSIAFVDEEVNKNSASDIEVIASPADQVYRDIENQLTDEQKNKLPVWENELVMSEHAIGGYTSRVMSKRWNRRAEELADMAERSSVIADYFGIADYNRESLTRSWKRVIAHHFHDDMPGTSCQRVYKRSWNDLYVSMNQFESELEASVSATAKLLKTDSCKGIPVTVFNPLEIQRKGVVTAILDNVSSKYARVFDGENEVTSQCKKTPDGKTEVIFVADVKSLGTKVYDVRESNVPCEITSEISVTNNTLENEKYTVTLNSNGDVCSIIDKLQNNRELLKAPVVTGLFDYTGSEEWPAWEMNYKEAAKAPDRIPSLVKSEIIENGPARVAIKVTQKDDRSEFNTIIALSCGGEAVEFYSEIEWQSLRTMAKNCFSFTADNEKATYDLGLGAIERGNMTEQLYEVPAQKWANITDASGDFGVSVLSECKYGWDKFDNNTLRLTVVHTPMHNYRIDSMQSMMDLGLNRHSFAIYSHIGKLDEETQLQARLFVQPMAAFVCEKHDGILGNEYSFGSISDNSVIIRAIKKAEESDEIIVRLGEGTKKNIDNVTLTLGNGIESAREVYASEEHLGDATAQNGKLVTSFKPYEIKSFALKLKDFGADTKKSISTPIELPFDKNIITKQGELGSFSYTMPYEITPEKFTFAGVDYVINKDSEKNALLAKGQKISVPENAKKLSILCASLDGDRKVKFNIDGKEIEKTVHDIFERPAKWDMYDFKQVAKIKDCRVALEITHCHKDWEDVTAKIMYFFEVSFDLNGNKEITLPKNKNIVIISATALNEASAKSVSPLCEKVPERKFTFKMTKQENRWYKERRKKKNLHDKKFYERKNWGKDY